MIGQLASIPNSVIGPLTSMPGARPHLEHRQHLMYNHYEPRLDRGKPNDPARGEMDVHFPDPSPPRWHADSMYLRNPRRTPFLPIINFDQITPLITIKIEHNYNRDEDLSGAYPAPSRVTKTVRAAGVRRAKAAPPCGPSESFTPERWPSFNTNDFQALASCSP